MRYHFFIVLFLIGCSSEKSINPGQNVDTVYHEAERLLARADYEDAAKRFKDIEDYFPYSEKACRAQVMAAYCHFCSGSYLDAIRAVEVFLRYHPSHELVPYAMYLRAMSLYVTVCSVGRDSKQALEAKKAFIEILNRFPESKYGEDSLKRIIILDDIIAAHELMIGRYYQYNKNALAAIGRYDYVLSEFSGTKAAEEACYRLIECCKSIGLIDEANIAIQSFKKQYPNSKWKLN